MIRRALTAAACLVLAACGARVRQGFPQHYVLTPTTAATAPNPGTRLPRGTLQIARIGAPPWLQGTAMYYRLAYRRAHALAAYAQSDWAAPPPALLEPVLAAALARGGAWRAVVGPDSAAQADYQLQIRLDDFAQVFSDPAHSHAALDATATLVDPRVDRVVAQTTFHLRVVAPSANAAGGVGALNRASHEFAARVQAWLRSVRPAPAG